MRKLFLSLFLLLCVLVGGSRVLAQDVVNVSFYGSDLQTHFNDSKRVKVKKTDPKRIARCVEWLQTAADVTLKDCQRIRQDMNLSDWAYVKLADKVSRACLGNTNEAVVLMATLLTGAGYDVQMAAESSKKLRLVFAADAFVYRHTYFHVDGKNYYLYGDTLKDAGNVRVSTAKMEGSRPVSFKNMDSQRFAEDMVLRTAISKKNDNFAFSYYVNKNLVDFYGDVPKFCYDNNFMTRWSSVANVPLESSLQSSLISKMKRHVAGLSQRDAVQQLLWWVQTGFEYKYDEDVWGYDRTFYAEETLYHPSCDTEDRSILLSRLVRDVLGLKVAFVYYPGHTAIGVNITDDDGRGAYVVQKGRHYVICDPTYIGSSVGEEMPLFAGKEKTVIELEN